MARQGASSLPTYTALKADRTYGGNRFQAQDINRIQAMPSVFLGIVQPVAAMPEESSRSASRILRGVA